MDEADLRERTRKTAAMLFHTVKGGPGYDLWKRFDPELRAHIHAALNVGATRREVSEVIMQQVTYGGMPVVVDGLRVYAEVLEERGEPFPAEG